MKITLVLTRSAFWAFCFAVFPKRLITFNPMQYVVWRGKKEEYELFSDEDGETASASTLSYEQYQRLEDFLKKKNNPALLPIQIVYYTGLHIGEVCALTWQDIKYRSASAASLISPVI